MENNKENNVIFERENIVREYSGGDLFVDRRDNEIYILLEYTGLLSGDGGEYGLFSITDGSIYENCISLEDGTIDEDTGLEYLGKRTITIT